MKVLMRIDRLNKEYVLLEISDKGAGCRIRKLVDKGHIGRSKDLALSEGDFLGVFTEEDINETEPDLIIPEEGMASC
ncbi:MAG: hypothetical protein ABIA77_00760 [Candidatus Omnitrophota bacterium]